jgi:hypothetical protein
LSSSSSSSSSLDGLGESPVPPSSIVASLSIVFLVYLCLVFRMVDIYMPVVECGYVPFFADVLSICSFILSCFRLKGKCQTYFLCIIFLILSSYYLPYTLCGTIQMVVYRKPVTYFNHMICYILYFINNNYFKKKIVEPYIDVLVFFTTDDGQQVGRNAFGL